MAGHYDTPLSRLVYGAGWYANDLARHLQLPVNTVGRIIRGETPLRAHQVSQWADEWNVSTQTILDAAEAIEQGSDTANGLRPPKPPQSRVSGSLAPTPTE